MNELMTVLNSSGCSAKQRWEASSMITSCEPAILRRISSRWPGVHSSYRPPTSSVRTPISGSRSMMSQVFRVPVTVNSLGPFIVLQTYCMASMPPQELPNRYRRSRLRAERTWASSVTNRSTFHKERSPGRSERPQPLVVEDDPPPVRQGFERLEVVVGEAGTAVQAQQRGRLGVVAHSAVPDLATRDVEVTLVDLHAALCWWPSASSLSATFGDRPGSRD